MIKMRSTNETIVNFYNGAYGFTIRIDVHELAWLQLFKASIIKLRTKTISELDILDIKDVVKGEISSLKLMLGPEPSLTFIPPKQPGYYPSFLWTVTTDDAIYMISALDRLIQKDTPGHYYFYEDGKYLIEFSYKE